MTPAEADELGVCRDCGAELEQPDPAEIDWEEVARGLGNNPADINLDHIKSIAHKFTVTLCDECGARRKYAPPEPPSLEDKMAEAGIPEKFWYWLVEDCTGLPRKLYAIISEKISIPVTVTGGVGVGKSAYCAIKAIREMENGREVLWINTGPWLKRTGALDVADRERAVTEVSNFAGLLVLDEFLSSPTPWKKETVLDVINTRCNNMLGTLINTSASMEQISECWDKAVASRLREGLVVQWDGRDRREP